MAQNTVTLGGIRVPIYTVAHLTDASMPGQRPVILDKQAFFTLLEANDFAREQSECHPAPQRFAVYDANWLFEGSWQCGKRLPVFEIVE